MALTLELYRSKLPEPEGRWFVVLARNKKGAVHTQKDVTELFEERYQADLAQALKNHEMVWNERLEREKKACENLQLRLNRALADKNAQEASAARLLCEQKQTLKLEHSNHLAEARDEYHKGIDEQLKTIHTLQAEVREKVSEIRKLKLQTQTTRQELDDYTARVTNLLEITSDRDTEQVHLARQEVKLKQGHLLYEELPWWKRLFRRPDPDLLPFDETSEQNKAICRWVYSRIVIDLKSRLQSQR